LIRREHLVYKGHWPLGEPSPPRRNRLQKNPKGFLETIFTLGFSWSQSWDLKGLGPEGSFLSFGGLVPKGPCKYALKYGHKNGPTPALKGPTLP